jgi:hypothetical protein
MEKWVIFDLFVSKNTGGDKKIAGFARNKLDSC